jgi:hypothetical protein
MRGPKKVLIMEKRRQRHVWSVNPALGESLLDTAKSRTRKKERERASMQCVLVRHSFASLASCFSLSCSPSRSSSLPLPPSALSAKAFHRSTHQKQLSNRKRYPVTDKLPPAFTTVRSASSISRRRTRYYHRSAAMDPSASQPAGECTSSSSSSRLHIRTLGDKMKVRSEEENGSGGRGMGSLPCWIGYWLISLPLRMCMWMHVCVCVCVCVFVCVCTCAPPGRHSRRRLQ